MNTRSDALDQLAVALAKAQGQMEGATKDSTNPHFRSKYADLASVWEACREPLSKNGLSVLQPVSADGPRVTVTTLLLHTSGQFIGEALTLTATQDTPQAVGSAITYGRRYGLSALVGIAPEDDDGNEASKAVATPQVKQEPSNHRDEVRAVLLKAVKGPRAGAKGELVTEHGEALLCYDERAVGLAEQCCQNAERVELIIGRSQSGNRYVKGIKRAEPKPAQPELVAAGEMAL